MLESVFDRRRWVSGIVLLLVMAIMPTTASASTLSSSTGPPALSLSPSIVEQVINPGQSSDFDITLNNLSNSPMPLYASASPFNNNGYVEKGVVQWLTFQQPDLLILPHQSQTEIVTTSVPRQAEAGAHYVTIYFTLLVPVNALEGNTSPVVPRIGALASIIVRGNIKQSARLGPLQATTSSQGGPTTLSLSLTNTGNVYLLPHGSINVYKGNRRVAAFPLQGQVIFPGQTYVYRRIWLHHPLIGNFQLRAFITYGSSNVLLTAKPIDFTVTPWGLALELVALTMLVIIFYKFARQRLWRATKSLFSTSI